MKALKIIMVLTFISLIAIIWVFSWNESSSCPDGSDLIDDDVCVDVNGNHFAATKGVDFMENIMFNTIVTILIIYAGSSIYMFYDGMDIINER